MIHVMGRGGVAGIVEGGQTMTSWSSAVLVVLLFLTVFENHSELNAHCIFV